MKKEQYVSKDKMGISLAFLLFCFAVVIFSWKGSLAGVIGSFVMALIMFFGLTQELKKERTGVDL